MNKKVAKPDLTGLHIRVSPVYTAFVKALGGTTQTSNIAQVYTYMENGTVQGFGWPSLGWVPTWAEVTKYRLDPGFYSSALHTLVNLKTWKKLPEGGPGPDHQGRPRIRGPVGAPGRGVPGEDQEDPRLVRREGDRDHRVQGRRSREVAEDGLRGRLEGGSRPQPRARGEAEEALHQAVGAASRGGRGGAGPGRRRLSCPPGRANGRTARPS